MTQNRPKSIQIDRKLSNTGIQLPKAFDRWNAGLQALDSSSPNVLVLSGPVGEDFWSDSAITAKFVANWLAGKSGQDIEIHLNSPGGDMFEGIAIYNLLTQHIGNVTVKVIGLAASAASIIAMAGHEILMGDASFMMIHKAQVLAYGNDEDFTATAEWLKPFNNALADVYTTRTGHSIDEVMAWMSADAGEGTYFSQAQSIELGFADGKIAADRVIENASVKASGRTKSDLLKAELALCAHMPRSEARALLNRVKGKPDAAIETTNAKPDAGENWISEAAALLHALQQKD